jgi:hypothetical protein
MSEITIKLPPLWAFAVVGVFCYLFYFAVSRAEDKKQAARNAANEQIMLRATAHACAPWKVDSAQYDDCASEFRAYDQCTLAWLRVSDREGLRNSRVACEQPVYKFHERFMAEVEQLDHSAEKNQKQ